VGCGKQLFAWSTALRYFGILFGAIGDQAFHVAILVDRPTVFIGAKFNS